MVIMFTYKIVSPLDNCIAVGETPAADTKEVFPGSS